MHKLIIAAAILLATASAGRAERLPPVSDATAKAECGDCHMAYSPILLPQATWEKIMANLSDHYGEDASLDPATVKVVLDYYVKNSNDMVKNKYGKIFEDLKKEKIAKGKNVKYLRPPGILRTAKKWSSKATPDRIQDLPRFKSKHSFSQTCRPVIAGLMQRANITSLGFCSGCHARMPKDGSSGLNFQFMANMTAQEQQTALTDAERKCLDE